MLVVGGTACANTRELARLCRTRNPRTWQIENASDLDTLDLSGVETVGIPSGLSTSADRVEEIKAKLMADKRQ